MKQSQVALLHGVVRLVSGQRIFSSKELGRAWIAWGVLRREFPDALAMVLMPNHAHILVESSPSRFGKRLRRFKRILSHKFPGVKWEGEAPSRVIPDSQHLARQVRYVHLNPCRKKLQNDPLSWPWSTHRELCGLILYQSPGISRLRKLVRAPSLGWHHYISADPSVNVSGTVCPEILPLRSISAGEELLRAPTHQQWESLARSLFGYRLLARATREARALAAVLARREGSLGSQTPCYSTVYRLSRQFRSHFTPRDLDLMFLSATDPRLRAGALECPVNLLRRKRRTPRRTLH